jgi:alpha-glucosidase (family GH31 glycosyl hydrolase)
VPLFRPLLLEFQNDYNTLNLDDEFMIGSTLLVAPILKPSMMKRMVYLPEGTWVDYWTGRKHAGGAMIQVDAPLDTVPMFVRAGAIIPMWPAMNYAGEKPIEQVTFEIYPNTEPRATYELYEDDGASQAYTRGVSRRTKISAVRSGGGIQVEISVPEGNYNPGQRSLIFAMKYASQSQ